MKNTLKKLEKQIKTLDMVSKIIPLFFLLLFILDVFFQFMPIIKLLIAGSVAFSITAIIWWVYIIYSLQFLLEIFSQLSLDLLEVKKEFCEIKEDFEKSAFPFDLLDKDD